MRTSVFASTLLALCASAFSQDTDRPTQRIQPMNSDSQTTAFFYQKPVVLDRDQHKGLRLKTADARFAAKNQAVPLVVSEFPEASLEYPIAFTKGQALFDEQGSPTELAKGVMQMLADFQNQAKATANWIKQLDDASLLVQQNLQVRLGDGRHAVVDGVWIVDEAKLHQLSADKVLAWFKSGELAALHAQMLSLRNLVPLLERSQPPAEKQDKPARKSSKPKAP